MIRVRRSAGTRNWYLCSGSSVSRVLLYPTESFFLDLGPDYDGLGCRKSRTANP